MKRWLIGLVLLGILIPIPAQNYTIQDRLKAFRVARLDAMRQLGESIKGLHITAKATVEDFTLENDEVQSLFESSLKGAEEIERTQKPNGVCEVTMVITLDHVIAELQKIYRHYPSRYFSRRQISKLRKYTKKRIFYATGKGYIKKGNKSSYGNIQVTQKGKLLALRAAKIDAYRKIAERIKGVHITSYTTVKDFVTESDSIRSEFNNFIRGIEFVGSPRYKSEGVVEVTAEVTINKLVKALIRINKRHSYCHSKWSSRHFYNIYQHSNSPVIRAVGSGVPPENHVFRPKQQQYSNYDNYDSYDNYGSYNKYDNSSFQTNSKSYAPQWATVTIQVAGVGIHSDRKVAFHSAKQDAYQNLALQIMKLEVQNGVTVKDFLVRNQSLQKKLRNWIEKAQFKKVRPSRGKVTVYAQLYLGDLWQIIEYKLQRNF